MGYKRTQRMIIIGVTGSFGTGKTMVANMLSDLGAKVIDADEIAHKVIVPKREVWEKVILSFGEDILGEGGFINRGRLADKVFGNQELLKKLCDIIHPEVIREIKRRLEQFKETNPEGMVVIDAPLLIEVGLEEIVDKLIVVKASSQNQLIRCMNRTGLSRAQIEKRIKAQLPLEEKIKLADYVIDNNGTLKETMEQVKKIWKTVNR